MRISLCRSYIELPRCVMWFQPSVQVLVKWKGKAEEEDTSWVDESEFGKKIQEFRLEGKAVLAGEAIDTQEQVYWRRGKRLSG